VKKTTRVKTISGNEYLYEITYYYDPEQKRTRQKSKYLGKNVNGVPVRVREQSKYPKNVYGLGEFLPYRQARLKLELDSLLRIYFTPTEIKVLLGILYAGLTNQNALYNSSGWYQSTVMYMRNPSLKFNPQTITKLLQKIGDNDIPSLFCQDLMNFLNTHQTVVYGLSIDTGIRNSELYNGSIAGIEPKCENLTLIYDSNENLPVFYAPRNSPLPGMPSSQEARAALQSLSLDTRSTLLIQGRNSYTPMNLHELQISKVPYLLPTPTNASEIKEIERQNQSFLMDYKNSRMYNNNIIFTVPFRTTIHDKPVKGHLYCDPQKAHIEQKQICEDLRHICDRLEQIHVYAWMKPANIVKEIAGIYEPFIEWKVEGKNLEITLKTKAISRYMRKVGRFTLLYSGVNRQWDTCLSYYDIHAEDSHFMTQLMERKQAFPYICHNQAVAQGLLFVSYLSLLLRRWVINHMKESGLLDIYTPEKIFLELEKIKLIEYTKRKVRPTQLSMKQKEILAALDLQIEY